MSKRKNKKKKEVRLLNLFWLLFLFGEYLLKKGKDRDHSALDYYLWKISFVSDFWEILGQIEVFFQSW